MRRVIVSADDFGLSEAVNEGIERAHRDGVLGTASLMVSAPAADDAVARARRMPGLRVGLHLVVIEGDATLAHGGGRSGWLGRRLTGADNRFRSDQLGLGVAYAFDGAMRAALRAEIRAQFEAFAATGLPLDHANAHKHMHLHPVVGAMMLEIGRGFGLRHVRVPAEPPVAGISGGWALLQWSRLLRRQVRRAGMRTTDHCFGLAWSGAMRTDRVLRLLDALPAGSSEIYFHPAAARDATIARWMPSYEHAAELAALTDPRVREKMRGLAADWGTVGTR